jgi:hypothetical protein
MCAFGAKVVFGAKGCFGGKDTFGAEGGFGADAANKSEVLGDGRVNDLVRRWVDRTEALR